MTSLKLYESALIEQNKLEAPALLIEDYNYLINKAIIQYINLTYARFDLNQQTSDDLRWLQKSVELDVSRITRIVHPMEEANYVCVLPNDYFHILGCTVHFSPKKDAKKTCRESSTNEIFSLCRRLTANQDPAIIQNAYLRPTYKNPYFYINESGFGGSHTAEYELKNLMDPCSAYGSVISPCNCSDNTVPNNPNEDVCDGRGLTTVRDEVYHIMNPCINQQDTCSNGRLMEIRCGTNKNYYPDVAYVDYLRYPKTIELTWEDIHGVEDHTPECEFPNAVAYDIINVFTRLLLENASDERLRTHPVLNPIGTQIESK